ncbi:recombinase family protein [Nonomuraea sp. NN258]|uniref:recombinase family protein n=1 Tax=Nonomuraea antri TaxID=2730852 RepID=UPI001567D8CA|nr:recombinase family protein [Nonomuraea antri]NRQ37682.1 recombinase family protein [Nonomuraea antri]
MSFPWEDSDDAAAVQAAEIPLSVAWLGRTSTDDQQDPTLSLPRQLRSSRDALPDNALIVAHFYDVESGRMDLAARGQGHAHEAFDIPIARDGGIQDLLAEAKRPDRRFAAVICESVERVARRTYFGTKIEYELEQAGVLLLAADEPMPQLDQPRGGRSRKRASRVLTRRVKQAVAEWYVLQMLELSWDAFCEHTEQGWNVGKPCYGYRAKKIPHPVAAKRAEGRSKSRLIPHPVEGPTVTHIFMLRSVYRLGYDAIADRLNLEPQKYPPPTPVDPRRALGRWSGSAVRDVLANPKYTGYMVWNRRATKQGGKNNPPSEWVWSRQPTHEPLVTKEIFQQVAAIARTRQGSSSNPGPSNQPRAKRTYPFRSYVFCDPCNRRMHGKTKRKIQYYACEPDMRHHKDRRDWYAKHPKSLWVREDDLFDCVQEFFAERVFGPKRMATLAEELAKGTPKDNSARDHLEKEISDLERRQRNVLDQIEDHIPSGDDEIDRDFRERLQRRYSDLARTRKAKREELNALVEAEQPQDDQTILNELPRLKVDLEAIGDELRRKLFDAFRLELRYRVDAHELLIRITVKEDNVPAIMALTSDIASPAAPDGAAEIVPPVLVPPQGALTV